MTEVETSPLPGSTVELELSAAWFVVLELERECPNMMTLGEIAEKILKNLSEAESKALHLLRNGHVADFGKEEKENLAQATGWGERTIRAGFIRGLCTDPSKVNELKPHGLRIRGAKIEGQLKLDELEISIDISLRECFIHS
ncbi:hypothetical protein [Geobacter sp.]|uniref:hypothetical protein n=1 Tax=Geobacter sp. TaxID=46610 RepID=UPI002620D5C4|nr:hypothetical protein [Geobacter sp.]